MSLTYTVNHAGGFLHVVATGIVCADDLAQHVAAVQADPLAGAYAQSLFDLRQAQSAIGYAELVIFRDYLSANLMDCEKCSWALLVCSDVSYGLARMFATLSDDMALKVEIFTDEGDAHMWLHQRRTQPSDQIEIDV